MFAVSIDSQFVLRKTHRYHNTDVIDLFLQL